MSLRRVVALASAVAALAACGPSEQFPESEEATADYQRQRTDIVGGTVANGDPAVVALAVRGNGQYAEFCTGTLIGPKTVLTAAHCYFPYGSPERYDYYAVFGTYVASPSSAVKIAAMTRHPNYSSRDTRNDIAVVQLTTAVTQVTPIGVNTTPLDNSWLGRTIRHVGFGNIRPGDGSGTKREVSYGIRRIFDPVIESGTSGKQTCTGDSGGPGFIKHPGSTAEVVAGVVSYGDQNCNVEGYDTNVATYASWVLNTMAGWEGPSCLEDNRCKQGCVPVDTDCVCIGDNFCNPECTNLDKDPDCPKNCAADGICAQGDCPTPDVDCAGEGQTCSQPEQCLWRVCIGDPQHVGLYCSKTCNTHAECTVSGMECSGGYCRYAQRPTADVNEPCDANTLCTEGACTGPTFQDLRCRVLCDGPGTCPGSSQTCVQGVTSAMYCAEPGQQNTGTGNGQPGAPSTPNPNAQVNTGISCSSTSGGPWWLALIALGGIMLRGRRLRRTLAAGAVGSIVALGGCGPTEQQALESPTLSTGKKEIVGGSIDNGDPEVFMLMSHWNNGKGSSCTATLVGNSTLVTAAHCVDPVLAGASGGMIWASNKTNANQSSEADWIEVEMPAKIHPGWNPQVGLDDDIAMARLKRSPGVTPKQWNTTPLTSSFRNQPLRAIGYGITSNDAQGTSGVKRHVNLVFDQIDATHIYLGDGSGKGVCHGDSGGPSFHVFSDGVERIVGVHSYDASGECLYGGDIRIDAYQDFVRKWLATWEEPTCAEDGRCKATGCTTFDVDCYCVADGVCTAECKTPEIDPDCPVDCAANGVCAAEECPARDVDCVPAGETCTREDQCQSRICMNDPQHSDFYCSQPCATTAQCPAGMECVPGSQVCRHKQLPEIGYGQACTPGESHCAQGTVCTGLSANSALCAVQCENTAECPAQHTCELAYTGNLKFCNPPARGAGDHLGGDGPGAAGTGERVRGRGWGAGVGLAAGGGGRAEPAEAS